MGDAQTLDFEIRPNPHQVPDGERASLLADPGFGRVFTDHMVTVRYAEGKGWYDARIEARAPIPLDPATAVLHYAQEIFEGLKAYRAVDGGVVMFRPEANAARFRASAVRMAMEPVPEQLFLGAVRELVRVDRNWFPPAEDGSLYLRPFMFASEVFLGVKPSAEYLFCVIASPVGPYFKGAGRPVSVWLSDRYSRAAPGGTGSAKCGGNYASSLAAQAEAIRYGCDQVVFLDAVQREHVEELGGMNIFFCFDDGTVLTPPLNGSILPGITRDSVLTLARDSGRPVLEEPYSVSRWRADAASGRLREVFACGTAAVLTPIGRVCSPDGEFTVGDPEIAGPTTQMLRKRLVDIQRGRAGDPYGWVYRVI